MLQWERRHPWRRLTTSNSKQLGRPRRLSLPQLVLPVRWRGRWRGDFQSPVLRSPLGYSGVRRLGNRRSVRGGAISNRPFFGRRLEKASRRGVFLGADWEGACFARPLERRVSRSGGGPGADWERACFARPLERRHSWRRPATSHSRKTGRPRRLSLPQFVLLPQREKERKDRPSSEVKNQDAQPPSFEATQRSKEGARTDASPNDKRRLAGRRTPAYQCR